MTRKDYVLIAGTLKTVRSTITSSNVNDELTKAMLSAVSLVARELSINMAVDNPKFDRNRFLLAAGNPLSLRS